MLFLLLLFVVEHDNGPQAGYHAALCDDRSVGIVIGDRSYHCNYGYTIVEYRRKDGVNVVI